MINFNILDPADFHRLDEKDKKKYIKDIKEEIKKSDNAVIKKMENIVKRSVKHYKNDFYVYDLDLIKKHKGPFLWMTREMGTDFIPLKNFKGALVDFYNCIKYTNDNFYFCDGKKLKKVTFDEMEKIVSKHKKKLLTSHWLVAIIKVAKTKRRVDQMSFNGYRNWETWLFMLHFSEYLFESLKEYDDVDYKTVYNTVESLIYEMLNGIENVHIGSSFLKDLLNASLNEVDVEEIADLLFEELKEY